MAEHDDDDRCLALAGVFQAADLVRAVARTGEAEPTAVETSLGSVFVQDPGGVLEIYGGDASGLRIGLAAIRARLGGRPGPEALESTRYAIGLLHLERRLHQRPQMLREIGERISHAQRLMELNDAGLAGVTTGLAEIYRDTLSTLSPRIMVSGEPQLLNDPARAAQIRALLLAGIRSAVLWRQCGGSRWSLLLRRRALVQAAERWLGRV